MPCCEGYRRNKTAWQQKNYVRPNLRASDVRKDKPSEREGLTRLRWSWDWQKGTGRILKKGYVVTGNAKSS
ncbi:hypothetical protein OS493_033143 [Desmophyllum pertusum]|uniref:Uncharacterized protein n=1 Tax=Desmophyllum pertusum TaxID=174260 RepID=A0A9X0CHQ0_9CNID|nr:hypothetical protein OS493_033143 [Desmophyllum pertusum]